MQIMLDKKMTFYKIIKIQITCQPGIIGLAGNTNYFFAFFYLFKSSLPNQTLISEVLHKS